MLRELKKKAIFAAGDIRREHCLGGFAWGKYEHLIDFDEAAEGLQQAEYGYVGLHRNRGDLSNIAIPGFMKHAWIHTDSTDRIIEAVSEGVPKRHAFHALLSDYAIITKPLVPKAARTQAVKRVEWISELECPYDDKFSFDFEIIEEALFKDKTLAEMNMKKYCLGVSCTEAVALGYVGHRRELGLYRVKVGKRQAIMPDNFLTTRFKIVWASKHTTVDNAHKLGLPEEGCEMLKEYWAARK